MNGYDGAGYTNGRREDSRPASSAGNTTKTFVHIVDLKARAEETVSNTTTHVPISKCVEIAHQAANQADTFENFRRPDLAYVEYLVASEIVLNRIPRHKDFPTLQSDRGRYNGLYKELIKRIQEKGDRYAAIRNIIINDNSRSGVKPESIILRAATSALGQAANVPPAQRSPRYSMPAVPSHGYNSAPSHDVATGHHDSRPGSAAGDAAKTRPPVQPKPKNLHGKALHQGQSAGGIGVDALSERFAKLRATPQASQIDTSMGEGSARTGRTSWDMSMQMPSPSDYHAQGDGIAKPSGPRGMPSATIASPPPHPPKLPLDTGPAISMPKPPSPTYSPARNMAAPGGFNPPRSTARSIVGTGGRSNSIASSASAHPPGNVSQPDSYFPSQNGTRAAIPTRRASITGLPQDLQIGAEKLYDYTRMYRILLIDVRTREDFDEGHIFSQNVMCIEPSVIKPNMSAEQLENSLVLSPDQELSWFEERNQFDLVVYYDQSTSSTAFLQRPAKDFTEETLKNLFDALHEFNFEKPLRRPPILLQGGVDAWCDLLGSNTLATSRTTTMDGGKSRAARPIRRDRVSSNASRLSLHRKRTYAPLDPEEEQKWRENARLERAAVEQPTLAEADENCDEAGSPILRTTEDFMRRFPEPQHLDQQSMMYPPKRPETAPAQPSQPRVPTIPSRPPPSVPRVSYSGVHAREASQPASDSRTSQLPAYIPPSRSAQHQLPKTGLVNFGVTCYMNSTVQCLNATTPLTRIFLDDRFASLIQRQNWKSTKGLMSEHYATLIKSLWQQDVRAIRPTSLRRLCGRFNAEWSQDQQQDAKEFLEFLLDMLHEDMNSNWSHPPLRALTDSDEAYREKLPKPYAAQVEWQRWSTREKSIITDLFAGQHASRLRCATCGYTSTTFEAFYSISVEIPRDRPADIRDCLRSYCSEERLDKSDVWKCPNCKKEREALKQITLTRAPHFLVVHLKRFSASHAERARKVRTPIEFPLRGLDMTPFMLPPVTPAEEQIIMRQQDGPNQLKKLKDDTTMKPPYVYNAYAVMRHIGNNISSGHYIAMVKDSSKGCWRQFNDDRVNDFDPEQLPRADRLQNEQAYIVFYERDRNVI